MSGDPRLLKLNGLANGDYSATVATVAIEVSFVAGNRAIQRDENLPVRFRFIERGPNTIQHWRTRPRREYSYCTLLVYYFLLLGPNLLHCVRL